MAALLLASAAHGLPAKHMSSSAAEVQGCRDIGAKDLCASWEGIPCDKETATECGISEEQLSDVRALCPGTCGLCPSSLTNDPVFHYGNEWYKVNMPPGKAYPILNWEKGGVKFSLLGETFGKKHNRNAQWFDSFRLVAEDEETGDVTNLVNVRRAAAKGQEPSPGFKTMHVELEGKLLSRTDGRGNGKMSETHLIGHGVRVMMEKSDHKIGHHKRSETMTITAGDLSLTISTRAAKKFAMPSKQLEFSHLNLQLSTMPMTATGFLAELSGQKPLSDASKTYLAKTYFNTSKGMPHTRQEVWAAWDARTQSLQSGEVESAFPRGTCPCIPKSSYDYNQPITYTAYKGDYTFLEADLLCKKNGMVLAEARTAAENAAIKALALSAFDEPKDVSGHVWLASTNKDLFNDRYGFIVNALRNCAIENGKVVPRSMDATCDFDFVKGARVVLTEMVKLANATGQTMEVHEDVADLLDLKSSSSDYGIYNNGGYRTIKPDGSWTWHSECGSSRFYHGNAKFQCKRQDGSDCVGPPGQPDPDCAYHNWAIGEPNNYFLDDSEDCLQMWLKDLGWVPKKLPGEWNDMRCSTPQNVICASRPSAKKFDCDSANQHYCDRLGCTNTVWHSHASDGYTCGSHIEWVAQNSADYAGVTDFDSACTFVATQDLTKDVCGACGPGPSSIIESATAQVLTETESPAANVLAPESDAVADEGQ